MATELDCERWCALVMCVDAEEKRVTNHVRMWADALMMHIRLAPLAPPAPLLPGGGVHAAPPGAMAGALAALGYTPDMVYKF